MGTVTVLDPVVAVAMEESLAGISLDATLDSTSTAGKSIKKKKSIPRIFIMARKKSFRSKPSSPEVIPSLPAAPIAFSIPTYPIPSAAAKTDVPPLGSADNEYEGAQKENTRSMECSPPCQKNSAAQSLGTIDGNTRGNDAKNEVGSMSVCGDSGPLWKPIEKQPASKDAVLRDHPYHQPRGPINFSLTTRWKQDTSVNQPLYSQLQNHRPQRPYTAVHHKFPDSLQDSPQALSLWVDSARQADEENMANPKLINHDHWIPWQSSNIREEMRESVRSGLSTGSSHPDSCSTTYSSIFTKMSSVSDMTAVDLEEIEYAKHTSMTVDDAIDLYSAGFDDDFGLEDGDPMKPASVDDVGRRSWRIAEAMNDSIDAFQPMHITLPSPETEWPMNISSNGAFTSIFPQPPTLRAPSSTHDRYGFNKMSRDITMAQYDAWHSEYAAIEERRCIKWANFMKDQGCPLKDPTRFPDRSAKVQRFVRKGIPPAFRGQAWFFYAGGDALLQRHPGLYMELVLRSQTPKLSTNDKEAIERDLNRTFPDNIHFKPETPLTPTAETTIVSSLRRVLSAFAVYHPRTGYCQSLNFVAGLLLLFLPEEKAFWLLHIMTKFYLPGTHEMSLEGANVDLWVLMTALKEAVPSIWAKIGGDVQPHTSRLPPISLCTTSWFMSLFIGTLPIESVLRTWDLLFYEGSRTLFRVALAVFKLGETEIRNVSDPMEIFQVVQSLPRKMLDIGALMGVACRRGGVAQGWVEKKRGERREWYARERANEKARKELRGSGRMEEERGKVTGETKAVEGEGEGEGEVEDGHEALQALQSARNRTNTGWRSRIGFGKA